MLAVSDTGCPRQGFPCTRMGIHALTAVSGAGCPSVLKEGFGNIDG